MLKPPAQEEGIDSSPAYCLLLQTDLLCRIIYSFHQAFWILTKRHRRRLCTVCRYDVLLSTGIERTVSYRTLSMDKYRNPMQQQ